MTQPLDLNFTGRRAVVLHPAETVRDVLIARLAVLGVTATGNWPEASDLAGADFVFLDVDMGHDGQIPWPPGTAPIPLIALIRSESPGRLAWALGQHCDAFLSQAALGLVYSTLVIASAKCAERLRTIHREAEIARRAGLRDVLVRAVLAIMAAEGLDDLTALKRLRALAMIERIPLEDAAARYLQQGTARRKGEHR
ncbi:ANTAR domain-containing response regulator [Rhodovulum euryhalinum]|uniref:AmiR/NasT family two-component response regulator n=1 Tax=Rhodovulum euryhalinum TaxID=35805 RepID=A0A4R2KJB5_9RHOB|nr:transcriptional antiterminator [Rhodovulum euryhalinum]TCO70098.1 AmiR/NasT family two-component response regulator [Rhodovulum euryhalinum]